MSKLVSDQADGLRRLLAQSSARIIAIASMGHQPGATTTAMNLGAALAHMGKDVLLLDEHSLEMNSVSAEWALDPLGTLADVVYKRLTCDGAAARTPGGVSVLPAPLGGQPDHTDPRLLWSGDMILVDAALDGVGNLSPLARMADELVVVLQPNPASITATYSGIKRLHYAHALRQLRLLINRVADPEAARQTMANLVDTGSRYLAVSMQPAGWVRTDPHMPDARRLGQTVVEAFPTSPAAVDFRVIAAAVSQWPWRPAARPQDARAALWRPEALMPEPANEEEDDRVYRTGNL
ncbi:flagellar biosynthesis protein FlhG [Variovorax sp. TBS-050B]|uniref:MinD/ParA family ATP-binding protein n=1 Tax=Variovorax sp. TBS-050B TaxID=2940551 RepID=UPI002475000B|nr:flagellar biosynthesis protein FlhG [Variovorax sp. TBS-050B]MDH6591075.1 flagellar biosynthesis protein FlhG [Variovorax sp. TBS-050B]